MSTAVLESLNASLKSETEAMVGVLDRLDNEKSPTDDQLKTWGEEVNQREANIKSLNAQIAEQVRRQGLRQEAKSTLDAISQPQNPMVHGGGGTRHVEVKTWGERFVEDQQIKDWYKAFAPSGTFSERTSLKSPPVTINEGVKALLTGLSGWTARSDTSGGALVQLDQRGLLDTGVWQRPLRIRDLVSKGTTTGDVIEYVRISGVTNAAAPVAESTASSGSSGAKPESDMQFQVVQDRVRTIAHWVMATRRALSDASQLRTYIDQFLRYGLMEELEDQMVAGSGTGENFTGVLNVSGTLSQAFSTDRLETARKAVTNLILNGRVMPSAWVLHPSDWEAIDLLTDNEERYYFGGPLNLGTPRLWGVPVVQSEAMTQGTAMLADWSFAVLWDREETNILVSDSHADTFIRNLITILAEMRAGFGVLRPKAFCEVAWS